MKIITEYFDKNLGKMAIAEWEGNEIWLFRFINDCWVSYRKMSDEDKKVLKQSGIIIEI